MYKLFTNCQAVQSLAVSLTCLVTVTCAAQHLYFPGGLVNNSATHSRALPRPQKPARQLVAGMKIERTLAPPDEHIYTAQLENGAAIIAEADQEGIDLVIDVYGPDGQQVTRLDSPNGTQGPEPVNFTALQSGIYKFVVRAGDNGAKPGKYVMKVNQILGTVENAKRLAKDRYPTQVLHDLWEASLTDPKAVERFISNHKQSGPIIEAIPGNSLENCSSRLSSRISSLK